MLELKKKPSTYIWTVLILLPLQVIAILVFMWLEQQASFASLSAILGKDSAMPYLAQQLHSYSAPLLLSWLGSMALDILLLLASVNFFNNFNSAPRGSRRHSAS